MLPLRLNALVEMGPGAASKAIMEVIENGTFNYETIKKALLFRRVRASLSQKWMVPSEPVSLSLNRERE